MVGQYVPASVEPQADLNCLVTGRVAALEPVPSVTAELQLAETDLS